MLGALEHLDFFTDGAFPLQAYMCDEVATVPFAASLQQSWAWPFAPLVTTLRLWGLTLILLTSSILTQQVLVALNSGGRDNYEGPALAADLLGYGALAEYYTAKVPEKLEGPQMP
eukprot:gb/GFBE01070318.1/.p1 GENE.gb/GFBE01070318.1/~~gb/GFBE01070318.1/.p1  ORF type:complete len:115 (+),score=10.77 gb/GFBE01070318.1/:1-345(+)